jgi:mono/diheme cytochrome c family protein
MPHHNTTPFKRMFLSLFIITGFLLISGSAIAADQAASTFQSTCSPCHGANAHGGTSLGKSLHVPDLHSAAIQKTPDAKLHEIISNGQNSMPPFAGRLSDAEIDGLIAYIHSLEKPHK